ncbi:hypothetical protein KCTCHS21_32110 [Cohnella abietis]|uniref:Uncharacterized protein n=1 Tax=Cohnella abietis TaxID=2507935 RepID=A0A3T1D6V9_9BACL|nr:hypothetical protein KCTCHS21_32110 [Cohnella abietis]
MKAAKEQDYKVFMCYIGLQDVQLHIDRVASRVGQGGTGLRKKISGGDMVNL